MNVRTKCIVLCGLPLDQGYTFVTGILRTVCAVLRVPKMSKPALKLTICSCIDPDR